MILNLIVIGQGADDVGANVTFVAESFEAAPDAGEGVFDECWFVGGGGGGGSRGVGRGGVEINPLFYFDGAGSVVEFVGYVCGLG